MLTIEQKEIRKQGLGATDCAAVMGLSPYRTPYELWMIKTGRAEEEAILNDDRLRLRHAHEETIAREYAFRKNVKLKRVNQTLFHKKYPFMLCNLDRVVIGERKIVECKSSSGFMRPTWGANGTDEAPMMYLLQVQHQMSVSGYEDSEIAALIDIDDYRIYPTPRNNKIIERIESESDRFWNEHVLADVPPPPTTRGDLKLMYPLNNGKFIEATQDVMSYLDTLEGFKANIKEIEGEKEKVEKELIQFIADHDGIVKDEKILATFQANKAGNRTLLIKKRA